MLFLAGFLTHYSYYKFKIPVLFCRLYNQPVLNPSAKFPVNFCNVCISIKLQLLHCITYSTFHIFIQSTISINNFTNSQMTFQHFCSKANSIVVILSARAKVNTQVELKQDKTIFCFLFLISLQRFRTTVYIKEGENGCWLLNERIYFFFLFCLLE